MAFMEQFGRSLVADQEGDKRVSKSRTITFDLTTTNLITDHILFIPSIILRTAVDSYIQR